ncbi:10947_t:CDS:2 [Funneliformis geosporum]|uniref:10947_t:CDS:1 n=1 Tax=Funneliformis geosporum TaxID=1117311 RepID=A0A9W4ST69_9GLOM|nr:10947_t:CDS:2 [Funneliformis geosporum]
MLKLKSPNIEELIGNKFEKTDARQIFKGKARLKDQINLRKYLQQNYNQLTWKQRINIIENIIEAVSRLHHENSIHRDLHSGNILYSEYNGTWYISDFGFCGPADKPLESIYGNLPYIAPEVINGKGYTFASDIYSIGMLMWEISSGRPPFAHFDHDYDLAINLIKGMRPQIVQETPTEYKNLMADVSNPIATNAQINNIKLNLSNKQG